MDFDKLGLFYLGRRIDAGTGQTTDVPVLYDASDLVTHAVIVGMTGSGKTGLGITLIEEAALDGIPVLAIDPKGDLSNLLLTFPSLAAEAFAPWVNVDQARAAGQEVEAFAADEAAKWKRGLAAWGQDGERIGRLRRAAEFSIYTPGSSAGTPISIVRSFRAPAPALLEDAELLSDRVTTAATSLLTLAGLDAEPLRSREHLLISTLLDESWRRGQDLELPTLIAHVQTPPVTKVGVMELEAFYPAQDRFALAMRLNHLLAAPGFTLWLQGAALDLGTLLYTAAATPRVSVISLSHLDDRERMFFVSLLLNEVVAWMRTQRGTTALRALVYFDEILGFLPPVANPPSKSPMLRLLKQARAFGIGCALATQNPVDLDYKALSNAGTWLLGRLQTERDKARVLDGLETLTATGDRGVDRANLDARLSSLGKRHFVLHNVHDPELMIFETRWAMSYLRGPMSRDEIRRLAAGAEAEPSTDAGGTGAPATTSAPIEGQGAILEVSDPSVAGSGQRRGPAAHAAHAASGVPVLPFPQYFVPGPGSTWTPSLVGVVRLIYADAKLSVDETRDVTLVTPIRHGPVAVDWEQAALADFTTADLQDTPGNGARTFAPLPPKAAEIKSYERWTRDLATWAAGSQTLELLRSPKLKLTSQADESEREFAARVQIARREARDAAVQKVRDKYRARVEAAEGRVRRAEAAIQRETQQATDSKMQAGVSVASTIFGALLGRKAMSTSTLGRATTAARGVSRVGREAQDVARAEATLARSQEARDALAAEVEAAMRAVSEAWESGEETFERVLVRPKRSGVSVHLLALVWVAG